MARNTRGKQAEQGFSYAAGEAPPMIGGTPGTPGGQQKHLSPTGQVIQGMVGPSGRPLSIDEGPPGRQYQVVGGPGFVMYASAKTPIRMGKIVSDVNCDVDLLRRQGVVLREIVRESKPTNPPPPDVVEIADAPASEE
jgi:hypothetical protein